MRQSELFLDAIRIAVVEHGLPAKEIAALAGLQERTITRHIEQAELQPQLPYTPAAIRRRFGRLARDVLPKMEAAARALTDKRGDWNKTRLDAVTQLSRLLDRFGELAGYEEEQQKESAKDRDEQTARVLRKIDDRIVELACVMAQRMGEEKSSGSRSELDHS